MNRILIFFTLFCLSQIDATTTLSELVSYALEHNPDTKISWLNAKKAKGELSVAQSAYSPKVDLNASIEKGKNFKYINGPDVTYTQGSIDLTVSMLLYDFGRRHLEVEACKKKLDAANWKKEYTIQKVLLDVLQHGYQLYDLQERLKLANLSLNDAEKMVNFAQELYKAGMKPRSDCTKAKSDLLQQQIEVTKLQTAKEIASLELSKATGRAPESDIELAPIDTFPTIEMQETKALIERAQNSRLDYQQKKAELDEATIREEKAFSDLLPTLSFSSTVGQSRYFDSHSKETTVSGKLLLDIPLFSGFETLYKTEIARHDAKKSLHELEKLALEITTEITKYQKKILESTKLIEITQEAVKNSEELFSRELELYKETDKSSFEELSRAYRDLVSSRIFHQEAKKALLDNITLLAFAIGVVEDA